MSVDPGFTAGAEAPLAALAWGAAGAAVVSLLFSVLAALLERSGPIRLRHWAEEAGGGLLALYERTPRFEAFRFLLSTLAKLAPMVLFWTFQALLQALGQPLAVALPAALVVAGLVVGASEVINRLLVLQDAEEALERLTRLYQAVRWPLMPVLAVLGPLFRERVVPRNGDEEEDEASDEEIEAFIDVGTREGILEPREGELLWGLVEFGETAVRSVMTPRIDMICADADMALDDLAGLFVDCGHSRIPLYEGSIDQIVGILHLRDLVRGMRSDPPPSALALANAPVFVPETKNLGRLLEELQAENQQMAVVVDEYGGTSGLVTVEDLVEEIFGELLDEHDAVLEEDREIEDGRWLLSGSSPVETLEEIYDVDLGEVPFETVGGLVFSLFGYVPQVGESVRHKGLEFTVESIAKRRIVRLTAERLAPEEPESGPAEEGEPEEEP